MIDIYKSEAIIKAYRMLQKRCDILDKFIYDHAIYFGPCSEEYSATDAYDTIVELMDKKNQLINLKLMIDNAIDLLSEKDKKTILLKMNYKLTNDEIGEVLGVKKRTVFRRVEQAFSSLASTINKLNYSKKIENIISTQKWLKFLCDNIKEKHLNYKAVTENTL